MTTHYTPSLNIYITFRVFGSTRPRADKSVSLYAVLLSRPVVVCGLVCVCLLVCVWEEEVKGGGPLGLYVCLCVLHIEDHFHQQREVIRGN